MNVLETVKTALPDDIYQIRQVGDDDYIMGMYDPLTDSLFCEETHLNLEEVNELKSEKIYNAINCMLNYAAIEEEKHVVIVHDLDNNILIRKNASYIEDGDKIIDIIDPTDFKEVLRVRDLVAF